jgi:DinB superfamily
MSYNIKDLIAQQTSISRETREAFGALDAQRLNWQPNPGSWSIGQCLDHLLNTNTPYFPTIRKIIAGEQESTIWQKLPFFPVFFGRFIIKASDPQNAKKVSSPAVFKPSSSAIGADIVQRFIESQEQLLELMNGTKQIALEKIIITSPVARVVTYSLLDAYTIMALHNRRHFNQAKRVLESTGFPAASEIEVGSNNTLASRASA